MRRLRLRLPDAGAGIGFLPKELGRMPDRERKDSVGENRLICVDPYGSGRIVEAVGSYIAASFDGAVRYFLF